MSTDDDLRDLLNQTAREMKNLAESPSTWSAWLVYLFNQLEQQAMDASPMNADLYRDMLPSLQDAIRQRIRTGGW